MGKTKDDTVVIKNNKVYSSYYARACRIVPDRRLVAISIGIPENFGGEICRALNPPEFLLFGYKSGNISETEYEQIYYEQVLSKLNAHDVYEKLKGKVILCYCGKGKFCHRNIVLKWLSNYLGMEVIGGEI